MQIYDRFHTDTAEERLRYERRIKDVRISLREDYDRLNNLGVALFILFFALLVALFIWSDIILGGMLYGMIGAAGLCLIGGSIICFRVYHKTGDPEQADLYIFGMDGGDFIMLNPLYEELERVHPWNVHEIRILTAMKPTTRQRVIDHRSGITIFDPQRGDRTHYEYFGTPDPLPMAVLCSDGQAFDWRWIDDPIFRRDLQKWITFVPLGENAQPFVYLLQNTSCPVMIVREVYEAHGSALDALFRQSGMDISRLHFMQEETRQAQMTRII